MTVHTAVSANTLTVSVTGGTAPYLYSKDDINFNASPVFTVLTQGNYTVYVKDAHSCIGTATATIINSNSTSTLAITANVNGTTITANASGGTPPYCFSLNGTNYNPNNVFSNLSSGNYTVFVKDFYNNVKSANAAIINPACSSSTLSL